MKVVVQKEVKEVKEVVVQPEIVKDIKFTVEDKGTHVNIKANEYYLFKITNDGTCSRYSCIGKRLGLNVDFNGRIKIRNT